ncbi:ester cyclase [Flavobacterium bizetiae]|jgi:steroid delta-isomerase-like uncharacterized protein|uniref:ester cyclase n=1 Tax=Flavobacterium bizetiae TaxID=2704140 RepID=UPI0037568FE4
MENKETNALMKLFVEFINTANPELADQLISQEAVFYVPGNPEPMVGPQGYLTIINMMRAGFPDVQWSPDQILIDNNKAAVRFTMKGTHGADFFGIPATQRSIEVKAMNFYSFENGKIIEEYGMPDLLGLLLQIGGKVSS